ncbi:farnesyl-diphosphate synthase [Fomitiporia mediterranea MF3/22]|uniref:farnesyl-diphosphate synthase n=1 Tax=Fomitiporia mediterranea (strain MF3/22) TaxID=694068 RepID=UPI0004408C15|nr:farnesyl-diphosphate synthase [Fomitiporia mediterranea MF3/22]EJC99079.1 farnesyl-diphosphate synthase [Fomitiporia mediterranea MF3/22]
MSTSKQDKRQKFIDAFASIRDELIAHMATENMPKDAQEWFKNNLEYNVPGGKLNRGISVTDTVEILFGRQLSDKEYQRAAILGWSVELLQAFFLVSDDMMDQSITRRGQPCWYRQPHVGNIAINDSFMLEAAIYHLFRQHFRHEPYYADLLDLMHETTYQTEMGQLVDLITAPEESVDLSKFSLEKHRFIVLYKTAYYSFYLPVALALYFVSPTVPSVATPQSLKRAKDILLPLGEYFQVQDDYLDCFGTPEQIGKVGTDIIDNKCSWLINVALAHASTEQRKLLDECYGRKDAEKEKKVKQVYDELDLKGKYEKYEKESYEKVTGLINQLPADGPLKREVFTSFLEKIYKRTK